MSKINVIGIGDFGGILLNSIVKLNYRDCSYIAINTGEYSKHYSSNEKITIKEDDFGNLDMNDLMVLRDKLINCKLVVILTALDTAIDAKIVYQTLKIADKMNKDKRIIVTYPFSFEDKRTEIIKKYETKIFDLVDSPIYTINFEGVDKDEYMREEHYSVRNQFSDIYQTFLRENEIFINFEQIVNCELKRKITTKLLSKYTYYERFVPLAYMENFINFIYYYLLDDEQAYCDCYMLASQLSEMTFYNENELDKSIIQILYELADTFKNLKN
ncbi:hypothetical protein IZY60_10610 [Lutibacter sp. B2]|nr:hypothetical protein [Lutibacter sp. B2]